MITPSDQVIEKVLELLRKIEAKIEELTRIINAALSKIPGILHYIVDRVREGWDKLVAKLGEFWAWFADKLSYLGNPGLLNSAASEWKLMGGKVARLNEDITDLGLSVDDRWTGYASDQYKQSVEPQRTANTSIMSDFAEPIADAMTGLAGAIVAFWVGLGVALLSLVGAIAGGLTAAGTIIGLPAAPVLVVIGVVIFLASAGAGVAILYSSAATARISMQSTTKGISQWPLIATQ